MRNGLMLVGTEKNLNIGDYIQAVAAEQFFDHIDTYIERERLDEYDGDSIRMIMNGWYMHEPKHWPPSQKIVPLFVAFHINSLAKDKLLSVKSIEYLKTHEPIGCRDIGTAELLQSKGIKAYFSGCLTLTLGYKYKSNKKKSGKCYIVDPFYIIHRKNIGTILRNIVELPFYYKSVSKIQKKKAGNKSFKELLSLVSFYREYKRIFSKEILLSAEYITHESTDFNKLYPTDIEKLNYARTLVTKYAEASLVITSRIHCALPCLAVDTPVIYIENQQQAETSSCRLRGLKDLFNVIHWDDKHLKMDFQIDGKITPNTIIKNKIVHWKLAEALIKRCLEFTQHEK